MLDTISTPHCASNGVRKTKSVIKVFPSPSLSPSPSHLTFLPFKVFPVQIPYIPPSPPGVYLCGINFFFAHPKTQIPISAMAIFMLFIRHFPPPQTKNTQTSGLFFKILLGFRSDPRFGEELGQHVMGPGGGVWFLWWVFFFS